MIIVTGSPEGAARYIKKRLTGQDKVLCFSEELHLYPAECAMAYGTESQPETLARGLFAALRELDRDDIKTIYARCPTDGGEGFAVANRLKKAAGFYIVEGDADA